MIWVWIILLVLFLIFSKSILDMILDAIHKTFKGNKEKMHSGNGKPDDKSVIIE